MSAQDAPLAAARSGVVEELADIAAVGKAGQGVVARGVVELDVGLGDPVAAAPHGAEGEEADGEDHQRGERADAAPIS